MPSKREWMYIAVGVVAGIVLAPQIRRIPGVSKLPTV
jgi:hypothetical protein